MAHEPSFCCRRGLYRFIYRLSADSRPNGCRGHHRHCYTLQSTDCRRTRVDQQSRHDAGHVLFFVSPGRMAPQYGNRSCSHRSELCLALGQLRHHRVAAIVWFGHLRLGCRSDRLRAYACFVAPTHHTSMARTHHQTPSPPSVKTRDGVEFCCALCG